MENQKQLQSKIRIKNKIPMQQPQDNPSSIEQLKPQTVIQKPMIVDMQKPNVDFSDQSSIKKKKRDASDQSSIKKKKRDASQKSSVKISSGNTDNGLDYSR